MRSSHSGLAGTSSEALEEKRLVLGGGYGVNRVHSGGDHLIFGAGTSRLNSIPVLRVVLR